MAEFSVIILSKSGDFLLKNSEQIERQDHGVEAKKPYILTEDDEAHRIKAKRIFLPYEAVENIQYGNFKQEVAE